MNRSTRIKACVLSVVFTAVLLLAPFSPVYADSFPTYFNVNENNFYSASNIYVAYMELNQDQQDIANYLLGMYNLMYLGSRGFAFEQGAYQDESSFIAKIKSFGYRLFYNASGVALQSRMDDFFLKYASAVLLYASQCNVTFSTWFSNLDEDFIIPVDNGILNSFTLLYNDNSDLAISSYGDIVNPWESGIVYNYGMPSPVGYNQDFYNDWLSNHNNILFTNVGVETGNRPTQFIIAVDDNRIYDSVFIQRNENGYNSFRFGYSDLSVDSIAPSYSTLTLNLRNGRVEAYSSANMIARFQAITTSNYSDLSDFIEYIFDYTPFYPSYYAYSYSGFHGWYPLIKHVFLVDNLSTFSNPVEIFNNDSWDIIGISGNMVTPIDTVNLKPKVLTTINLPDNSQSSVSIRDIINDDNVVNDDGDPVEPWQVTQVVQPNDTNPISIDVNFFSGGKIYLEYLWEHTRKVVVFTKDLLDCFEFDAGNGNTYGPKYAIYGVLVLGIAGGLIAKFLL